MYMNITFQSKAAINANFVLQFPRFTTRLGNYNTFLWTFSGITWRCTIRNVKTYCKATVRQKGYMFFPGSVEHCHLAEQGALPMAKAFSRINKEIKARPLESPALVAKEVISTEFNQDSLDHISKAKLIRRAHYHRRSLHPNKGISPVNVKVMFWHCWSPLACVSCSYFSSCIGSAAFTFDFT